MSNLSQNQNQLAQTPMLGQLTNDPQPSTFACQIDPASVAAVICAGQSVKLVDKAGPQIMVDVCASTSDGPVFGVIIYNMRKNQYVAGDTVEVLGSGGVILLASSAAIARGANVAITNNTVTTNDPTIASDATSNDYVTGITMGKASAAGQLIKVRVQPAKNP